MQRSGSMQNRGPGMQRRNPGHRAEPMMQGGGPVYRDRNRGPVIEQQYPQYQYPAPPPPPDYRRDDGRSTHSEEWIGALILGGVLGAILANSGHHTTHGNYYIPEY